MGFSLARSSRGQEKGLQNQPPFPAPASDFSELKKHTPKSSSMSRFKIDDFPEHVQVQIRAQLKDYARPLAAPVNTPTTTPPPKSASGPNKTEAAYRQTCLRNLDARYEALTFRMSNGHRYTPDWVIFHEGKPVACHECKGGYALHSQQRARLAFDQCAKEFPGLVWVWAVKTPEGWRTSHV